MSVDEVGFGFGLCCPFVKSVVVVGLGLGLGFGFDGVFFLSSLVIAIPSLLTLDIHSATLGFISHLYLWIASFHLTLLARYLLTIVSLLMMSVGAARVVFSFRSFWGR
jgi:hypothetical protein